MLKTPSLLAFLCFMYYNIIIKTIKKYKKYYIHICGEMSMKIKDDFVLRKVADSYVVVPVNSLTLDFNGVINLNETGAFLFEQLQKGIEKDELIAKMISEYDVTKEKASADIDIFINKLKDANVFE